MKLFYSLLFVCCLFAFIPASTAQDLDVDLTDVSGNPHNVQNYLNDGKPVFIYGFSDDASAWSWYEFFEIQELYNVHGQGGSNDVVVLMLAGFGFENAAELSNIDYSAELGPGYDDLSFTEANPVPVVLLADFPDYNNFYEGAIFHVYCPQQEQFYMDGEDLNVDDYMEKLYTECCTALETFDPGLYPITSYYTPDCEPQVVEFTFSNESTFDIDSCLIDVIANGMWLDQFAISELVSGCASTIITYQNDVFAPGDSVTFAIAQNNDQTHNDTISIFIEPVDTVRGHIRGEILFPTETPYAAYLNQVIGLDNDQYSINAESNFKHDFFFPEGCYYLQASFPSMDTDMQDAHFHLASLNDDGSYEKILADTIGDDFFWSYMKGFNIYVEDPVDQQVWGYVFEDVNGTQTFHPDLPAIPNIQVDYGPYTTFTNFEGYYNFPEYIWTEFIEISYDPVVWPVLTTPDAGDVWPENYYSNFGLSSDDPVWEISAFLNNGMPYFCESWIGQYVNVVNSGNQPVSGTLEITYDDNLTYLESDPSPDDISGNTLTFEVPELGYNENFNVWIHYDTVPEDLIGETFTTFWSLTGYDVDDNEISFSSETVTDTLFCAYDPNDKYGFPLGVGPEGFIEADTPLKYRIRFQNIGNAPATNVTVVDTLPETLDWNSFAPVSSSHDHQIQMNAETREVKWIFNGINLPDSASDPLGSIGHIWFDIDMADLNLGDQILNEAHIFFDQNEAITTNTSLHTIADIETSISENGISFELYPNPAQNTLLLKTAQSQGYAVVISDLSGRVLRQSAITSTLTTLELSDLKSGVYLVSLVDQSTGLRSTKRLVKM